MVNGTAACRGRLEVASTDGWLNNYSGELAWRPVCDGPEFTESLAQVMCKLMGYKYGRKYYSAKTTYRGLSAPAPPASPFTDPVGFVYCSLRSSGRHHRRLLAAAGGGSAQRQQQQQQLLRGTTQQEAAVEEGQQQEGALQGRRGRSLQAPLQGTINLGSKAAYICTFRPGDCGYSGPLVSLDCSNNPLPPAPSPPPVPPDTPPPPPPAEIPIRLIGGKFMTTTVEPNLCEGNDLCRYYGRVELQMEWPEGSGTPVWAPLCANDYLSMLIGKLACDQVFQFLNPYPGETISTVPYVPRGDGFPIPPTGTVSGADTGAFDPAAIPAWVSVQAGDYEVLDSARVVHDLDLQVSASPCPDNLLFALSCGIRML